MVTLIWRTYSSQPSQPARCRRTVSLSSGGSTVEVVGDKLDELFAGELFAPGHAHRDGLRVPADNGSDQQDRDEQGGRG
jgi:hypothetical protein